MVVSGIAQSSSSFKATAVRGVELGITTVYVYMLSAKVPWHVTVCERSEHQWQGRGDGGDPQVLGSRNPNPDPKFEKVSEASGKRYIYAAAVARVVCGCYDANNESCDM